MNVLLWSFGRTPWTGAEVAEVVGGSILIVMVEIEVKFEIKAAGIVNVTGGDIGGGIEVLVEVEVSDEETFISPATISSNRS
ncbi:hypothetical protein MMC21_002091 [Puttea exsequens]|nr:hypothetical protein [Puttea exsequens]